MNETAIAWTDFTWNLFSGCKKISPECAHCYAEHLSEQHRRGGEAKGKPSAAFPHGFDLTVRPHKLDEPRKLLASHGPSLVFCESMSDIGLDDEELTFAERMRLIARGFMSMDHVRGAFFDTIEATPEHRYQILTKRPERLLTYFNAGRRLPSNVWLGTTIGHAKSVERLNVLRQFQGYGARVLFISAEPLLCDLAPLLDLRGIDWLIVGGESGNHFSKTRNPERFLVCRPYGTVGIYVPHVRGESWVCRLRDAAHASGTAFFFKQWGGPKPTSAGREVDGCTWDELPTVPGAMPDRRVDLGGAATAGLARKKSLPVVGGA